MNIITVTYGHIPGALKEATIYSGQTYRQALISLNITLTASSLITANGQPRQPDCIITDDIRSIIVSNHIKGN